MINQIAQILSREAVRQVDEVIPALDRERPSGIHEALMRAVVADILTDIALALKEQK